MNDKCILVTWMPWAWKTTFLSKLQRKYKDLSIISIDTIQEQLYDLEWFSNKEEKRDLHKKAFEKWLKQAQDDIKNNKIPVLEYPFDNRHIEQLKQIFKDVNILTIRLDLPVEKSYQRFHERDLSWNRHPWHFHSSYPNIWDEVPQYQSFEDYSEAMKRLNVAEFSLWKLLTLDASKIPFSDEHIFEYIDKKFLVK
jgi:hypothetical protein